MCLLNRHALRERGDIPVVFVPGEKTANDSALVVVIDVALVAL